ncbi:MAG: DUF6677 family protein [Phycisphaerae bacterium]
MDYLAISLSWLIPGVGQFFAGERARGLIFALTIHLLFGAGVFIGGIKSINPSDQPIWSITQFMTGWPMLAANAEQKYLSASHNLPPEYSPRVQDVGSVFCGIAGMLNLLVMFDAMLRLTGNRPGPATTTETAAPATPEGRR